MSWMGTLKICFEYLTRDSETGSWSSRATKGVEVRRRSFYPSIYPKPETDLRSLGMVRACSVGRGQALGMQFDATVESVLVELQIWQLYR